MGYAIYDVQPGAGEADRYRMKVSENSLENQYYRVRLNADGDVASIFDKSLGRELLAAPVRLAISYDNPEHWPAWNMDWEQEQAAPKTYVDGPAKIRVVENGPARVAIEVSRETAGSRFVQTISLSAGDAGKRVEFANTIDWNTKESNLKATFPLVASNQIATYNWDIGTIERPTAEPKKFEVPSHQWIDLTDMSGGFGATILTDCKNGSDKPNDHTIRLTLIRTPGTRGGYADQGTQDIGHHEFVYGIAGHAAGWRQAQTDWQAQRLNDPLIAFETSKHAGALGREFSLLKVSNPRIRVLALKKAEWGDEIIVRLVELEGRPQFGNSVAFDQMGAAGWEFVWLGPEVGDPGDLAVVGEIEEAQAGLGAFWPGELGPARCVLAFADDPLHGEVPVVGEAFDVEPDVGVPAADLLPGLGAAVEHVVGEQRAERIPVPGLGRGPVGRDHVMRTGHGGQVPGTFVRVLAQCAAAEPERGAADADGVLLRQHLARDPLAVDVCPVVAAQVGDLEAAVRVAVQLRVIPGDIKVCERDVVVRRPPDPDPLGRLGMRVGHGAILKACVKLWCGRRVVTGS